MSSWELFLTNLKIKLFAWWTIPLLAISGAKIIALDKRSVKVRIKHWWLTKNHIGGIYLGTQAIGADITGGALVLNAMNESDKKVSVAFKSMQCEFLKRPEADMIFTCNDGEIVDQMMEETFKTGERVNQEVTVLGSCPKLSDEIVSKFVLVLSVKFRKRTT
tara:strand:- start:100 stop:585 length:486 start_codon:yes stop_codon:yes gene_type:complete